MTKHVALIFGGTGGIGRAVCEALAGTMTVYATFHERRADIAGVTFLPCDVSCEQDVQRVFRSVAKAEGRIDCVVNAVSGKLTLLPFDTLGAETYLRDLNIHAMGGIHVITGVLPHLKANGGVILTLLTTALNGTPPPRMASYVAAKSALKAFIACARTELRSDAVRLMTISPGFVETDLIAAFPPKYLEMERNARPGNTFIKPNDLAALIAAILCAPASWMLDDLTVETQEDVLALLENRRHA